MIVMGESLLNLGSSKYFFNSIKNFLTQNKKISEEWNSFNILSCDASTVGNYDLGIINESNNLLENLSTREKLVIQLRFGLSDGRNRTLEEIGKMLGLTRERIRQIEKKAITKLRGIEGIGYLRELLV